MDYLVFKGINTFFKKDVNFLWDMTHFCFFGGFGFRKISGDFLFPNLESQWLESFSVFLSFLTFSCSFIGPQAHYLSLTNSLINNFFLVLASMLLLRSFFILYSWALGFCTFWKDCSLYPYIFYRYGLRYLSELEFCHAIESSGLYFIKYLDSFSMINLVF